MSLARTTDSALGADGVTSTGGGGDSHPIRLSLDEYGQLCAFMFNLGASFMSMQCLELDDDARDALREVWKSPTWAELEKRRRPTDEPCGLLPCHGRRHWCSRCIRADAVKRGAVKS